MKKQTYLNLLSNDRVLEEKELLSLPDNTVYLLAQLNNDGLFERGLLEVDVDELRPHNPTTLDDLKNTLYKVRKGKDLPEKHDYTYGFFEVMAYKKMK